MWAADGFEREGDVWKSAAREYQGRFTGALDVDACRALNLALAKGFRGGECATYRALTRDPAEI